MLYYNLIFIPIQSEMQVLINMKKRIQYAIVFLALLAIEIFIAVYVHDRIVRPYVGDILVIPVVYCFARIFLPESRRLILYVFMFAVLVEILQYFHLVDLLGLSGSRLARIALGSTFDVADICCYGVGALLTFGFERSIHLIGKKV